MGMGVERMCVIEFVVKWFRSHCSIVTAVALPPCQESRKQGGREEGRGAETGYVGMQSDRLKR